MAAGVMLAALAAAPAQAGCELQKVMTLKVDVQRNRPITDGMVNGRPIRALIDTGSSNGVLWGAAADRIGVKRSRFYGARVVGSGGASGLDYATIESFQLADFHAEDLTVAVIRGGEDNDFDYTIGQDLLARFDVEFDLAHGVVNLFKAKGCGDAALAYWSDNWTVAKLERRPDVPGSGRLGGPMVRVKVQVNGVPVRADLVTGAAVSFVTVQAAKRAGVSTDSPGVLPMRTTQGMGETQINHWWAVFDSFAIGDETVGNARIIIADMFKDLPAGSAPPEGHAEMLLGADFFRAHRIYIANSQNRVYFTHNGGAVFQVIHRDTDADDAEVQP